MRGQVFVFNKKGYSLVELMVSVAIAMIALAILGRAFVSQRKTYEEQSQVVEMQQQAKIAMHLMTSELNMAGYFPEATANRPTTNPHDGGAVRGVVDVGANSLTFMGHIDGDDDDYTETVRYEVDGTTLKRQKWNWTPGSGWTTNGAQSLVDNVQSLAVLYYDSAGSVTATAANVRQIKITLVVDSKKGDRSQTLSTNVTPRNLGL